MKAKRVAGKTIADPTARYPSPPRLSSAYDAADQNVEAMKKVRRLGVCDVAPWHDGAGLADGKAKEQTKGRLAHAERQGSWVDEKG